MQIAVDKSGAYTVARLKGDFGLDDGDKVLEQLQPLVAEPDSKLAVALDGVTFINSSGLNSLIAVATRARLSRSRLILVAPSSFVKGVLEVTQLDRWFEICDSLEEAARQFA
jgi:anti-anti-sigma factor